jgi:hypothetical protein
VDVLVEVLDSASVEAGRPSDDAVNLIALFQKEFSQVRSI